MRSYLSILMVALSVGIMSCHSSRKIKSAIPAIDTTKAVIVDSTIVDSAAYIRTIYSGVQKNLIDFRTFSARIKVDYMDKNGKGPELTVIARIKKDSAIWLSINATLFSYEAFRVMITPDSVKVLNKKDKVATLRSVGYLQEVAKLPFDFSTLQDLILGNPIYFSPNILSYKVNESDITVLCAGEFFKNLLTLNGENFLLLNSKLDDVNTLRNRTCYLSYSGYEQRNDVHFATKRKISVSEKSKLDVDLDFKQYNFNESLVFPFNIPKNYKVN